MEKKLCSIYVKKKFYDYRKKLDPDPGVQSESEFDPTETTVSEHFCKSKFDIDTWNRLPTVRPVPDAVPRTGAAVVQQGSPVPNSSVPAGICVGYKYILYLL